MDARERQRNDKEFVYDLDVYDASGKCVERMRGYRCRILDEYRDEAAIARVRLLHDMAAQRKNASAQATSTELEQGGVDAIV